ncbi:hypothetical protein KY284_031017 [Solanum tuberosum]|nr:hypothetical protein KY284_031017 [Solanum tuberosum]
MGECIMKRTMHVMLSTAFPRHFCLYLFVCSLYGFQVWIYEVFPYLEKYAGKSLDTPLPIPRLLRWYTSKSDDIFEGDPFKYKERSTKIVHSYLIPIVREMGQNYIKIFKSYMDEVKDAGIDVLKVQLKSVTVLTADNEDLTAIDEDFAAIDEYFTDGVNEVTVDVVNKVTCDHVDKLTGDVVDEVAVDDVVDDVVGAVDVIDEVAVAVDVVAVDFMTVDDVAGAFDPVTVNVVEEVAIDEVAVGKVAGAIDPVVVDVIDEVTGDAIDEVTEEKKEEEKQDNSVENSVDVMSIVMELNGEINGDEENN